MRRPAILLMIGATLVTVGCESTQDKSERLGQGGGAVLTEKGVVVRHQTSDVKVLSTEVLEDENGAAAVVAMRNVSKKALAQVPVSIDVRGSGGKSLFRNDQPGLGDRFDPRPAAGARREVLLGQRPGRSGSRPRSVKAKVGKAKSVNAGRVPQIVLTRAAASSRPRERHSGDRFRHQPLEGRAAGSRDLRGWKKGRRGRRRRARRRSSASSRASDRATRSFSSETRGEHRSSSPLHRRSSAGNTEREAPVTTEQHDRGLRSAAR